MVKQEEPIKIEVEDLADEVTKADRGSLDVAEELRTLGRQFAETVQSAWTSSERQRLESEFREGVQNFVEEIGKIVGEVKKSPAAERLRSEVAKVETTDAAQKTQGMIAQSLHWLSGELAALSEKLTPADSPPTEKAPPED